MDIDYSSIVPLEHGVKVQFPSFSWYCERVIYFQNNSLVSLPQSRQGVFESFRCSDLHHDIGRIILVSSFFWYIGVRMLLTESVYNEDLYLLRDWEIFSFLVMGKVYFAFIYTDISDKQQIITNFKNDGFIRWRLHANQFSLFNTLTETVVFNKQLSSPGEAHQFKSSAIAPYSLCVVEDPFYPYAKNFLDQLSNLLHSNNIMHSISAWDMHFFTFSAPLPEIHRLAGFLGKYVCILPEKTIELTEYLSREEAIDGKFILHETFTPSDTIEFLDPRWNDFRMGLLEFSYMEYTLREHIQNLMRGIESIDNLQDSRVLFQKTRLNMTLESAKKVYPLYKNQKELLIQLLKQKLS